MKKNSRIKYIFLERPNFKKAIGELKTTEDQWLYVLKHAFASKDEIEFSNDAVNEALERLKVSEDNKESNMITKKEYDCTIASIESAARKQERVESAKRMLKAGLDENQIALFSGLTLEEVKALSLS